MLPRRQKRMPPRLPAEVCLFKQKKRKKTAQKKLIFFLLFLYFLDGFFFDGFFVTSFRNGVLGGFYRRFLAISFMMVFYFFRRSSLSFDDGSWRGFFFLFGLYVVGQQLLICFCNNHVNIFFYVKRKEKKTHTSTVLLSHASCELRWHDHQVERQLH